MNKLVLLISHIPDPRMNKRIELLKKMYDVHLIYWNRDTLDIWDIKDNEINNIEIKIKANHINPVKRIIATIKFSIKAYKILNKLRANAIYTANIDMLVVPFIYKKYKNKNIKIFYEIADINKLVLNMGKSYKDKIISKIMVCIEKKMCQYINILIVTSEKFYEVYYSKFINSKKVIFIPNMPNLEVFKGYKNKETEFTIGFIGAIRYKNQMKMLINSSLQVQCNVLFAGTGLDNEIKDIANKYNNIEYYGKYDYDIEIKKLYEKVDCIYAVYDASLYNVKIALPNKLYEAIFCEKPIIVAKGTYLAELVEKLGVGVSVPHNDLNELSICIKKLKQDKEYYQKFVEKCKENKSMINIELYNNELLKKIEQCD